MYAIYEFDRFKRTFAVNTASEYLSVLQQTDEVSNAEENYRMRISTSRRSRRWADAGRTSEIEVDQAVQSELGARNRWVSAKEGYKNRIDAFKSSLGLPPDALVELDPNDLEAIVEPIADGVADYTKGNRLFYGDAWNMMPKHRYLGNSFLSLLTKIASGYWNIADSQSGYTAISLEALQSLQLDKVYKRYGMPNDLLIRLNTHDSRVKDIHVRPVYNIGEESGIKLCQVIPRIGCILFKGFWKRLFFKYRSFRKGSIC